PEVHVIDEVESIHLAHLAHCLHGAEEIPCSQATASVRGVNLLRSLPPQLTGNLVGSDVVRLRRHHLVVERRHASHPTTQCSDALQQGHDVGVEGPRCFLQCVHSCVDRTHLLSVHPLPQV